MKRLSVCLFILCSSGLTFAQSFREEINTHREKYKQDFVKEERSPLKQDDLQYLQFFDADSSYRVKAAFKKTKNPAPFDMATSSGQPRKYIEYGTLLFELNHKSYALKIYQSIALMQTDEYKDYLFLPFTDETNGKESYLNGRYLDFRMSDIKNNQVIIDFNKAYNPYCAYSSGYSCPRPPSENNLPVAIYAGEKNYAGKPH